METNAIIGLSVIALDVLRPNPNYGGRYNFGGIYWNDESA